jgi:hypothetical protein
MVVAGISKSSRKKEKRRPDQSGQGTDRQRETGFEEAMWVYLSGLGGG